MDRLLTPEQEGSETVFVTELERFLEPVKIHGAVNSLAQMVLKAASPGVPDFYQGTEMWELSLVDPDNRRPVDYALREKALDVLTAMAPLEAVKDVLGSLGDGRVKLLAMQKTLAVRNALRASFDNGGYTPLEVSDPEHAFAFMRGGDVLVVLPRFTYTLTQGAVRLPLGGDWREMHVALPSGAAGAWVNAITGEEIELKEGRLPLEQVFAAFPAALFTRKG